MFLKHRVAFANKDIFGIKFKPALDACFLVVSKMLFSGKIGMDGFIDVRNGGVLSKTEVWSYIYYLYFHNRANIPEFKAMRNVENGKASEERFYEVVYKGNKRFNTGIQVKPLDIMTLIVFVNKVIRSYEDIVNPVFDYLKVLSEKKNISVLNNISGVTLITGTDGRTGLKIVTDPREVAEANVKISIAQANV